MIMDIINIIKLLRPHQWLKNVFLFLPIFFGNQIMDFQCLLPTFIAFVAYSFLSSSVYCLNDIQDCELDKLHPEKRKRPLAAGKVSIREAYIIMILLFLISSAISPDSAERGVIFVLSSARSCLFLFSPCLGC